MIFLHAGHFSFNCWWDFFLLNVEDDDHLSSGFTENGAKKKGSISTGWFSSWKGKFSKVFSLPVGQQGRTALAREVLIETGQWSGGFWHQPGDRQPPTRKLVQTEIPGDAEGQGGVQEVGRSESGNRDQGTKVRTQAEGSVTERTQSRLESLTLKEWEDPGSLRRARRRLWEDTGSKSDGSSSNTRQRVLYEPPGAPTPHWWNVNAAPAQGFSAFLILCLLGLSYDVSIPSVCSTLPWVHSSSPGLFSIILNLFNAQEEPFFVASWAQGFIMKDCIVQSPPKKKQGQQSNIVIPRSIQGTISKFLFIEMTNM